MVNTYLFMNFIVVPSVLNEYLVGLIVTPANVSQFLWRSGMLRLFCPSSANLYCRERPFSVTNGRPTATSPLVRKIMSIRRWTIRCTSLFLKHMLILKTSRICGCVSKGRRSNKWVNTTVFYPLNLAEFMWRRKYGDRPLENLIRGIRDLYPVL